LTGADAGRDQAPAVRGVGDAEHRARLRVTEQLRGRCGRHVPHPGRTVAAACDQPRAVGAERDVRHETRVAGELEDLLPGRGVPDPRGAVVGPRGDAGTVRAPIEPDDAARVALEALHHGPGAGAPHGDLVAVRARQLTAV